MNEWEWQLLEDHAPVASVQVGSVELKKGDLVRLRPRKGGDIFDLALAGQVASIESIEQDYEGKLQVAVVLEDDPGKDLGVLRQPGHRFFFTPEELEPVTELPKILIAGIGNIFLGDDGFGVEVAHRLMNRNLPEEVRVVDFGIRGLDLTYALQDGYETTILIDAYAHGQTPGTVSVMEPDPNDIAAGPTGLVEAHSMDPLTVLRMARALNGFMGRVLLVGCEPATLGGEEGQMGLSEPVEKAVEEAVRTTETLVARILGGEKL